MKKDLSRRRFLQRTAGAASALAAANTLFLRDPRADAASYPAVAPSDRLRFGIIGIGMQGSGLLTAAVQLPGVECVAAADLYDGRHTLAREIVKAGKATGRVIQIGSQRVSSVLCAKAKELIAQGTIGDLMMVEGSLGRNDPTGAWEYPPPFDLSPQTLDWETWQGTAPHKPWDPDLSPKHFARWRCWKEYGTGVAGDLLVHLVSGMMFMLGVNEPPKRVLSTGGILRWKDGRDMRSEERRVGK